MWQDFIENFLTGLVVAGIIGLIGLTGRKPPIWILLMVLFVALVTSVPQLVFEYFPELDKGWVGFAVRTGIAVVISLPFSFLMQRFSRKRDHANMTDGPHTPPTFLIGFSPTAATAPV